MVDFDIFNRVDIDAELEKVDKEEKNTKTLKKADLSDVSLDIDTTGIQCSRHVYLDMKYRSNCVLNYATVLEVLFNRFSKSCTT